MTAPDPGEPYESEQEAAFWQQYRERHSDPGDVTRLAAALANYDGGPDWWEKTDDEERDGYRRQAAELLAPGGEVTRYGDRRAADEVQQAFRWAADAYYHRPVADVHDWLWETGDIRAAALRNGQQP